MLKTMATLVILGALSISEVRASPVQPSETKVVENTTTFEPSASNPTVDAAGKPVTPCCGEVASATAKGNYAPPPCSCPVSVFAVLGKNTVYYSSRYATNCNDSPTAAYVYGTYTCPLFCPDGGCIASRYASCMEPVEGGFPGFPQKFDRTYEHSMPSDGVSPIFARRLIDLDVPFISFVDNSSTPNERWAKVFTYRINVRGAHAVVKPECAGNPRPIDLVPQVIYFAFEISKTNGNGDVEPPPNLRPTGRATALNEKSQPTAGPSFVYVAKYNTPDGESIPILVLCAQ